MANGTGALSSLIQSYRINIANIYKFRAVCMLRNGVKMVL
jgi:hypothetical protein